MCEIPQWTSFEPVLYPQKNDGQEGKTGPILGMVTSGKQRVNRGDEGGWMWSMCFVFMYENRTIKSVEIV
jgi:hypothetical protein